MQSVLQTLGLNQYSCTSLSVPAFSIECLKNPSFHGDPAPGQPVFLAKKNKKKKRQQVGSGREGWPSSGSRGAWWSSLARDAGVEAEMWVLDCKMPSKGGWV